MTRTAPASCSTSTAEAAPRDSASIAPAPLPANRSRTPAPSRPGSRIANRVCLTRSVSGRVPGPGAASRTPARRARDDPARASATPQARARGVAGEHAAEPAVGQLRAERRRRSAQPPSSSSSRSARPGRGSRARDARAGQRRDPQPRQAALGEAQDVALAAQLEVPLRQLEPVRGRGHRLEPLVLGRALGGLARRARRTPASVPRPTRPRSWWSWASPNRSAPSITIIVASVDVDADLDDRRADEDVELAVAEARHLGVAVGGLEAAVDEADPQRREQPVSRRTPPRPRPPRPSRRPRRELVVAEEAVVLVALARPPRAAPIRGTTTNVRWPARRLLAHPVPGPLEVVRAADPGPDRDAARRAAVRRVETSRSAYSTWPRVRGIGVAVISRTCGAPPPALASSAPRCSTPNRCCSSTTASARSANATASWSSAWVPTTTCACPPDRLQRAPPRPPPGASPSAASTPTPRSSSSVATVSEVLAGEEVRRREQRGLAAGERGRGERPRGHGRLARADVALDQAEHRDRAGEVVPDLVDRRLLVRRERRRRGRACVRATPRARRGSSASAALVDRRSAPCAPGHGPAAARPSPAGARAARRTRAGGAPRRAARTSSGSGRPRAPRRSAAAPRRRGVRAAGTPGRRCPRRRAPRASPRAAGGGQPGGQPVDGHDPADVEQVRGVGRLELRIVERDPEPASA